MEASQCPDVRRIAGVSFASARSRGAEAGPEHSGRIFRRDRLWKAEMKPGDMGPGAR